MGSDGWLGVGWPKEFGGQGRPATDQFIFFDEVQRAAAPFPFVTLNTVGPTLMAFGSDEQKKEFLPGIVARRDQLRHRLHRARRRHRPGVAARRAPCATATSTSSTATRCSPAAPTRPTTSGWRVAPTPKRPSTAASRSCSCRPRRPGSAATPIMTVGGTKTTATYYADVRVPVANRVGEENAGWRMITTQLNHERVGLAALGGLAHRLWDDVARWASTAEAAPDQRMIDVPWVQLDLARTYAKARSDEAAELAHGRRGRRRDAQPGRLVRREGLRHRDRGRGVPRAARHRRRGRLPASPARPAPCSPANSKRRGARRRSTRSAAASTKCSARSWRAVGLGMARQAR